MKFKVGDKVKFNTKDSMYQNSHVRKEFKEYGLDCRKIYTIKEICKDSLISIEELLTHPLWHSSWWNKHEKNVKQKNKKYKNFLDKLSSLSTKEKASE